MLVSVNFFTVLDFPTTVAANEAVAGVNAAWAFPVPDSDTVCGLFVPLSLTESVPVSAPVWVGAKVTLIVQLFPAAKVLPQIFVCLKLALVVMLLKYIVAFELLVRVAFLAALDASTTTVPNERELGVRLMSAPLICGATVRLNVVAFVKLPDVPRMVTTSVPAVAEPVADRVSVLVEVAGFGVKVAVTPLGKPVADSMTLPLKPFCEFTVTVVVALLP